MATKVKLIETGAVTGNIIPDGGIATGKLADDAVTTIKISDGNITHAKLHTSMDLTGKTVTVATAAGSTNTTAAASTAFVQQELTTLIGGAPSTLDTLNELAAAINDDASYASTLTTALATKLPLAGGTMTGKLILGDLGNTTVAGLQLGNAGLGLSAPSTDQMNFITADTTRMVIDSSGNATFLGDLGMATGHSSGKFAVMSSSVHGSYDFYNNGTSYFNGTVIVDDHLSVTGTSAQLTLSRASTDQTAGFNLTNNQNGGYGSGIVWNSKRSDAGLLTAAEITVSGENSWNSDATSSSMMQFATRKDNTLTTHMTIRKTGNVGIGTTSPNGTGFDGNATVLSVNGYYRGMIELGSNNNVIGDMIGGIEFRNTASTEAYVRAYRDSNGDSEMRLGAHHFNFTSGNVGIGTDAPTMPLSVQAASNAYAISMHGRSDGYSELYGASNDGSTKYSFLQSHSAQTKLYTLVNTPLLFGTNSTERMRLSAAGDLQLESGAANKGYLQLSTQSNMYALMGGNYWGYLGYKTGGYHRWFGSDGVEEMRLSGDILTVPGHATNGGTPLILGSTGVTQYTDLIIKTNSGNGEIFKAGTGYTEWGGAAALNIYNSNEKIAFHPSGQANVVQMTSAGIVMGAGKGISFAANANATNMDNEILDDYEEGTWTPTVSSGTGTTQWAKYTKIGDIVYIVCEVTLGGTRTASVFSVGGLPFTNGPNWTPCSFYCQYYNNEGTQQASGAIAASSSSFKIIEFGNEAIGTAFGNGYFSFAATYKIN